MQQKRLIDGIIGGGQTVAELRSDTGGTVLLMPYGARVVGLFANDAGQNFLYANPYLQDPATARAIFDNPRWTNTGGDRTWIAPETETMIGDLRRPNETYTFPLGIDPGSYAVQETNQQITLCGQGRIPLFRQGGEATVGLEKTFRLQPHPLRHEADIQQLLSRVAYIGYEQQVTLTVHESTHPEAWLGIWNLLVMPASGWMLVPTLRKAVVRDILAPTPSERLLVDDHSVRFRLDGREQHKISLRAAEIIGRAGYLRELPDGSRMLVVRNFQVNPSGTYVDTPWDALDEVGYAFQSYNDDGSTGPFGELEYHAPAIQAAPGATSTDVSQVWAFHGDEGDMRALASTLLGINCA